MLALTFIANVEGDHPELLKAFSPSRSNNIHLQRKLSFRIQPERYKAIAVPSRATTRTTSHRRSAIRVRQRK